MRWPFDHFTFHLFYIGEESCHAVNLHVYVWFHNGDWQRIDLIEFSMDPDQALRKEVNDRGENDRPHYLCSCLQSRDIEKDRILSEFMNEWGFSYHMSLAREDAKLREWSFVDWADWESLPSLLDPCETTRTIHIPSLWLFWDPIGVLEVTESWDWFWIPCHWSWCEGLW
jgi:hypothetical protein